MTLHLEVVYSGDHNLSCYYMAEAVRVVAPSFKKELSWDIVYIFKKEGARRFYELSVALHGEENVKKHLCFAPVPSIFIDGKLIFNRIPMVEELEDVIRKMIAEKSG
ncbi:MAG: thioredoxin-like protein [Bacillota bacterium]